MLNRKKNMIIAKGKIITPDILHCVYNTKTHQYDIYFKNGKTYHYSYENVLWLKEPQVLNPSLYRLSHNEQELFNIAALYVFSGAGKKYWHVCFEDGSERDYDGNALQISVSCLSDQQSKNVLAYLSEIVNLISLRADDGSKLLPKQYAKLCFVEETTALAAYLNPKAFFKQSKNVSKTDLVPIFPFGCNASQFSAVKEALANQVSVIEGPPGTGKTQTILNIVANLLVNDQTVQIVSNNNSAIENVYEKLSARGLDFVVAFLGNFSNKDVFVKNQKGVYPDLSSWQNDDFDEKECIKNIAALSEDLNRLFRVQQELARARQELRQLDVEYCHFQNYAIAKNTLHFSVVGNCASPRLLALWQKCQYLADKGCSASFAFKLQCFFCGILNKKFYKLDLRRMLLALQELYYKTRKAELEKIIHKDESFLKMQHVDQLTEQLREESMQYLKYSLYCRYGCRSARMVFDSKDLFTKSSMVLKEYPVVLSTTFSSKNSLNPRTVFDYLIMDEASQVDVATGVLALSSAKHAVIVGDTAQLPNVVSEDLKKRAQAIWKSYQLGTGYNFSEYSFLESVCTILPNVPRTLLREHYRCHPKIIEFCNQKFYNGQLIIMTQDQGESNVLTVSKTVQGEHARDHMNQREIDVIEKEVLPSLHCAENQIGIIAPYNNQIQALKTVLDDTDIDISTVHKFQGREKDVIILTTVDNAFTEFTDDPNLLNVAVSRAKKQLWLVVSGNEQKDGNISDLISYIEYNNFAVVDSKVYSVFDYLYSAYTKSRLAYLKKYKRVSAYDSENLMYGLISDVLKQFLGLKVICHQPLNMLIRDTTLLNDEEYKYAMNGATHIDFLIYNRVSKKPVLAVEVDGYHYHKSGSKQAQRDVLKNQILQLIGIPFMRFPTNGSGEKEKLIAKLNEIYGNSNSFYFQERRDVQENGVL